MTGDGDTDRRCDRQSDASGVSTCAIAVMAKASAPGRTKTRLVPPLNFDEAAAFNTAFLQDISANIRAANEAVHGREGTTGRWIDTYMAFGPPGSEDFFRSHLPSDVALMEVWLPNFGDCLFRTISALLDRGHESAVVLNADSPTLPTSLLVETAQWLARPGDSAVFGPSSDGGYYLLGLKKPHRRLFDDIDWSTERVAQQTLARASEIGLDVHILPTWYDVDDVHALGTLHGELEGGCAFDATLTPYAARNTAALMGTLVQQADFLNRISAFLQQEGVGA
jgi:rSAM/selenodomain-associated transferase 1